MHFRNLMNWSARRRRNILGYFALPLLLLQTDSSGNSAPSSPENNSQTATQTIERLIVASGNVTMDLDLNRLNGIASTGESKLETLRFEVGPNSFFTILVFNNVLRGPEPGSMGLIGENSAVLPAPLNASSNQLVIEKLPSSEPFDLAVRDGKTGFVFFNIEGNLYDYDAATHLLSIKGGQTSDFRRVCEASLGVLRMLVRIVGRISIATTMYPIEITTVVNGAATIVDPASAQSQRARLWCRDPMSSWEICPHVQQFGK